MANAESTAVLEPVKSSKLEKFKSAAFATGVIVIPVALMGASIYFSVKMSKMQLDAAKLNFDAAKLNNPS